MTEEKKPPMTRRTFATTIAGTAAASIAAGMGIDRLWQAREIPVPDGCVRFKVEVDDNRLKDLNPYELQDINLVTDRLKIRLNGNPEQKIFKINYEISRPRGTQRYSFNIIAATFSNTTGGLINNANLFGKEKRTGSCYVLETEDSDDVKKLESVIKQLEKLDKIDSSKPSGKSDQVSIKAVSEELVAAMQAVSGKMRPVTPSAINLS